MIGVLKFENDLGLTHVPYIAGDMTAAHVGETLRYVAGAGDRLSCSLSNIEHRARQILLDAGHDPSRPGLLPEPLDHGCLLYDSHLILRHLNIFRSELVSDPPAATRRAILIDRTANKHDFLAEYGDAIRRGRKFISGPKRGRKDVLARAIIEAFEKFGAKASPRQVLAFLKKNTKFDFDDDDTIHWTSSGGREKTTTFKALQNRISELRRRS